VASLREELDLRDARLEQLERQAAALRDAIRARVASRVHEEQRELALTT
jgi:hypothetical protein